jgi:uncharacterized protein YndB with AHSA1/START domain
MTTAPATTADREILQTRYLAAPRDLVWQVWTDPSHVGNWYGPDGFTLTTLHHDLRTGGAWRFVMHGPDGIDYPNLIRYTRVEPPALMEYHQDADGQPVDDDDIAFDTTITFEEEGAGTRLTMRLVFPSGELRDRNVATHNSIEGGRQTLAKFEAYLASLR